MKIRVNSSSDLHRVPWFDKRVAQVQAVGRFLDLSRLVAGEQTPATSSEVGQHGRSAFAFHHQFVYLYGDAFPQLLHTFIFSHTVMMEAATHLPLTEMIFVLKGLNTTILACVSSHQLITLQIS